MSEKNGDPNVKNSQLPIIDSGSKFPEIEPAPQGRQYSTEFAARWSGVSTARIRQYAEIYQRGTKFGKRSWQFTWEDIRLFYNLHYFKSVDGVGKSRPMRNVTPRVEAETGKILDGEDRILKYIDKEFKRLRSDASLMLYDVDRGLLNQISIVDTRYDRRTYKLEEEIRQLRDELRELKKRKEVKGGRGVPVLAGKTLPTPLTDYEAQAA